ncbi:alpha/beta hydrolase family protein [Paraconexibacter algicola]|uniref:Alpha/beta hydrolase n=1 Tax=Paraconexibacter algicola TaxID=2133960 RepID=A0A2T4ULT3_9ACTN|nr:alpha/beta hydrolase [Paraconexibacter algicola]PTL60174.1 alpha/beta hydrolase [Paraconexibacter algicola]
MSITTQVVRHALLQHPQRRRVADHKDGRAELLVPTGPGPHPVAIVVHGGYWRTQYGSLIMRPLCADLRRRGWATWNIEYGRIGRGGRGGWPTTFTDVAAMVDHLTRLADERLDLSRVVVVGHSAGGQLALWIGGRAGLPVGAVGADPALTVAHVVALSPVTDMVRAGAPAAAVLGGTVQDVPDHFAQADPMRRLPLGVPVTIVHPVADATVPVARSREYVTAARAAGADVELLEPATGGHREVIDPGHAAWRAAGERLDRLRATV